MNGVHFAERAVSLGAFCGQGVVLRFCISWCMCTFWAVAKPYSVVLQRVALKTACCSMLHLGQFQNLIVRLNKLNRTLRPKSYRVSCVPSAIKCAKLRRIRSFRITHSRTHTCTHTHTHTHTHTRTHAYTYGLHLAYLVCIYACRKCAKLRRLISSLITHTYTYAHTYTYDLNLAYAMCIYTQCVKHRRIRICRITYYINTHKYTHTHIHTHTHYLHFAYGMCIYVCRKCEKPGRMRSCHITYTNTYTHTHTHILFTSHIRDAYICVSKCVKPRRMRFCHITYIQWHIHTHTYTHTRTHTQTQTDTICTSHMWSEDMFVECVWNREGSGSVALHTYTHTQTYTRTYTQTHTRARTHTTYGSHMCSSHMWDVCM